MKKIFIWDDEDIVPNTSCEIILWNSSSSKSNQVSISDIVETNDKILRDLYLSHIHELGLLNIKNDNIINYLKMDDCLSFWWLTLYSQKCNFIKSENINNIIKFMAFELWAEENEFSSIELRSHNKDLYFCLKKWCQKKDIEFISNYRNFSASKIKIIHTSVILIKSVLNLFVDLIKRWDLKGHNLDLWRDFKGKVTFFSYFNKDFIDSNGQALITNFWGDLPKEIDNLDKKTNWLHLLAKDYNKSSNNQIISTLNDLTGKTNQTHLTIYSFLSLSLVINVVKEWIKILYKSRKLKSILFGGLSIYEKNYLLFFSEEDFYKSFYGSEGLNSILYFYLIKEAVSSLPNQDIGLFLQENQPWEIILISHWKANNHKKIIGCPHSTIRFWDLRYYFAKETIDLNIKYKLPIANYFALNGDHAYKIFEEMDYSQDYLFKVEALRYKHLNNIIKSPQSIKLRKEDPKKILILGDYSKSSTIKSVRLIQDAFKNLLIDKEYTLKPHPSCLISKTDLDLKDIKITNAPIKDIISKCNIVFSCNVTSAALDSYFYDIPIICYHDLSKLNLSPVRDLDNVYFINTSEELRVLISNDINIVPKDQNFNYFYLDNGFSGWKKLLQIDDIKPNIVNK